MTLVAAVVGERSLWLVADRRLSVAQKAPQDDALKVFSLDATDGVALFGYAGLGATAKKAQPAQWMSNVLRGRAVDIESAMVAIADAASRQLPQHLARLPLAGTAVHTVLVPAFVGGQPRLYTIDTTQPKDGSVGETAINRHMSEHISVPSAFCPLFRAIGSGASSFPSARDWWRPFISLMRACDRGQVRPHVVAGRLAGLAHAVYLKAPNAHVSANCVVTWRFNPAYAGKWSSGHALFSAGQFEPNAPGLPTVVQGLDLQAVVAVIRSHAEKTILQVRAGKLDTQVDRGTMNTELGKLPRLPDELLP